MHSESINPTASWSFEFYQITTQDYALINTKLSVHVIIFCPKIEKSLLKCLVHNVFDCDISCTELEFHKEHLLLRDYSFTVMKIDG